MNVKEMVAAANAVVPKISPDEAKRLVAEKNALVVDVRDAPEVQASGKVKGAVNVSRGMLDFRADPDSPYHDKAFSKDRPVILYCASGGRSPASCSRISATARAISPLAGEKGFSRSCRAFRVAKS